MSPGALRQVTPWCSASPLRGRTKPAWPSGIATAIPQPTEARPPPRSELGVLVRDEVAAGVGVVGVARELRALGERHHRDRDHAGRLAKRGRAALGACRPSSVHARGRRAG